MIQIIKGYATSAVIELSENPSNWILVGESTNYTLSGCTYTSNTLTIPSASVSSVPVGDYLLMASLSTGILQIDHAKVQNLAYVKSHAERVLDAIEATLEGRATKEQTEVQVAGRMVRYLSLTELMAARSQYKNLVQAEQAANNLQSDAFNGRIRTRWGL